MTTSPRWAYQADAGQFRDDELGDLFAFGKSLHPQKIAINDGRHSYTYAQLDEMVARLAQWLARQGVQAADYVPVLAEKDAIMPVIGVACWKLGAVYVPLDGQLPEARVRKLLARMEAKVVLAVSHPPLDNAGLWLSGEALRVVCEQPVAEIAGITAYRHQPQDTAYVIFTSGSTGEPKGVEISVGSLKDYFVAHNQWLRFTPSSRVFSLSPFHFDVSIEDTLLPLSLGAFVWQFASIHAGAIMRSIIIREKITHLIAVSTLLSLITENGKHIQAENFPALEMVMTGAEVCDPKIINLWKHNLPGIRLINAYGPTETTIVCFCYEIEQPDDGRTTSWPIGTPLQDVDYLILDENQQQTDKTDIPGELCVGGTLVMKGYLKQPEETTKVVFEHQGVRYYRTGDICLRQPDGNILYLGRRDDEVKIAGRRIHLGEIRQKCLATKGAERVAIRKVVVNGKEHIAMVIIGKESHELGNIETSLAAELPRYMLPTLWGWAEEVNLSTNGKTDEKTLLDQLVDAAGQQNSRYFIRREGGSFTPLLRGDA
ncbi:amino acid adenylation domain-containing protein [Salmonella enterica subsp. enterica]|nr:amino acid adenylation domain-containing protein [Salmonella enterica]EBQ9479962.1 amino acid adenylation protein [Salmonella enterica subsp. enterica serovar Kokomlemle]ECS5198535.1 amino acid adenylation domain-containing protein [Salmonella enterica subsp. enterica serovar Poano]EBJ7122027.1 amino acid adenylation domain-containing protein [Salmonella enterica]ECX4750926.1 amino acid adenylation domain-containing protein [Salmonella enterica]